MEARKNAMSAQRGISRTLWAAVVVLLVSLPAFAHVESGKAAGFRNGLWHPVSGLDHVLAMVAVGLWGAQLGVPAVWVLPVAFPMVMAFGGMIGLMGVPLPGVELGIAVSALALGAMVATAARPPLWGAAVLVGCFAVFHGNAHGTELPPGNSAILYSIGFVTATGLLHATGIALGLVHHWKAGKIAIRTAGGGICLAGLFFLCRVLAG